MAFSQLDAQAIARSHGLGRRGPAVDFFQGALLGNGGLGVVVTTRPDAIVIHCGHNGVWDIRVSEEHAADIGTFADVMALAEQGVGPGSAFDTYRLRSEEGYAKPYPRPYPCGSLVLGFDQRHVEVLGHSLDIADGICRVQLLSDGQQSEVELFVDQSSDRLFLRHQRDGEPAPSPFNRIRLLPDPDGLLDDGVAAMTAAEIAIANTIAAELAEHADIIVPGDLDDHSIAFGQRLPARLDRAKSERDEMFRLSLRANQALPHGSRQNWYGVEEAAPRLERRLDGAPLELCLQLDHGLAEGFEDRLVPLPDPHAAYAPAARNSAANWSAYWARSAIALDDIELERPWYRNTYFLHCAIRQGALCPGLFGPWRYREIGTAWHGDYHMNYNTQQVFWGVFSSNRIEQHLPFVDYVDAVRPLARSWATDYFGMEGECFPHVAYPVDSTIPGCPAPPWGWEMCETPWTVQSLWWHFQYSQDRSFLRERAMPALRGATRFMVDFISRADARGARWDDDRWHIFPTVVPELYGLTENFRLNYDCLVDLTLTRFLLRAFIEATGVLDTGLADAELLAGVHQVLDHLPDYATASSPDGEVLVSTPQEQPGAVFNVPVLSMTVFPGDEDGLHSSPERLDLLRRTHRHQRLEGGNELVFQNLQAARLGILDLERFKRQIAYCELPNGATADLLLQVGGRYNDATAFDFMAPMGIFIENFGLTAVINECLLQSYNGVLRFFPNYPAGRHAQFANLRTVGAFLVSAQLQADGVAWIDITAEATGTLNLIIPWADGARCTGAGHSSLHLFANAEISLVAGDHIRLTPLGLMETPHV